MFIFNKNIQQEYVSYTKLRRFSDYDNSFIYIINYHINKDNTVNRLNIIIGLVVIDR